MAQNQQLIGTEMDKKMKAGIQLDFYLGQRVTYDGMPGVLTALSIEDDGIIGTIFLDEPIVLEAMPEYKMQEERIFRQCVQIHKLQAA